MWTRRRCRVMRDKLGLSTDDNDNDCDKNHRAALEYICTMVKTTMPSAAVDGTS